MRLLLGDLDVTRIYFFDKNFQFVKQQVVLQYPAFALMIGFF